MKRIDFMGLPGSGKSTVYNQLKKIRSRHWLCFDEAKKRAVYSCLLQDNKTLKSRIKGFVKLRLVKNRTINRIINTEKQIINSWCNKFFLSFAIENEAFISACTESYKMFNASSSVRFFLSAKWFVQSVAVIQLVHEQLKQDVRVVFDESLCHKVLEVINFDYDSITELQRKQIEKIFWTMPVPCAVIYFDEDLTLVEKRLTQEPRLRQREVLKKPAGSLRRWIEDASLLNETGKYILKKRDVRFLELPRGEDVGAKLLAINTFLKNS